MSLVDIVIVGILVVLLIALLHANNVLGSRTPYQYVKDNEEMIGNQFPIHMRLSEKIRLLNILGISSNYPSRIWPLLVAVVLFFLWSWFSV